MIVSGAFTEKLAALETQMEILRPIVKEATAELEKSEPVITNNGVAVVKGDQARELIKGFLALHDAMDALATDFRRTFGS